MAVSSSKSASHRAAKKEACRQAIIRAAIALFEQKGFDATTMDEIAHAAEVSRPTVFNYFARKEEILTGFTDIMRERISAVASLATAAESPAPLDTLKRILVTQAAVFSEFPETSHAFHLLKMQESHCRKGPSPEEQNERNRYVGFLAGIIGRAQELELVRRDFDSREMALHLMIGLFASVIGPWQGGFFRDEALPDVIGRHFDLFIQGMLPR
jgi:AcrR family transcriptional regulator